MSAFEVGSDHIDALITAGLVLPRPHGPMVWLWPEITPKDIESYLASQPGSPWGEGAHMLYEERRHELTTETAGRVGAMLAAENRRSIDFRYNEEELEQPYEFRQLRGHPDALVALKAISCLRYQSCEHPGWSASEAATFLDALEQVAIGALPGYGDAPGWEVRDRDVFVKRAAVAR